MTPSSLHSIVSPFVKGVIDELNTHLSPLYLIGGTLREGMINKPYQGDLDLLVSKPLRECQTILTNAGYEVNLDDTRHNSLIIPLKRNESPKNIQITTFRHLPSQPATLEEDLRHRDITINAMALCWNNVRLHDPFGGLEDLRNSWIRLVQGGASLEEDPLRALRFYRFAVQIDGTPDPHDIKMVDVTLMHRVPRDRLRAEVDRIFSMPLRTKNCQMLLHRLFNAPMGASIMPEISLLKEVFDPELGLSLWEVTLNAILALHEHPLEERSLLIDLRWAALLHGISLAEALKPESTETPIVEEASVAPISNVHSYLTQAHRIAGTILERFRFSNRRRRRVLRMIHHMDLGLSPSERMMRRLIKRDIPIEGILHLVKAFSEVHAKTPTEVAQVAVEFHKSLRRCKNIMNAAFSLTSHDLKLSGWEIIDMVRERPGPWVGKLQKELVDWISVDRTRNQRDTLTQRITNMITERKLCINGRYADPLSGKS